MQALLLRFSFICFIVRVRIWIITIIVTLHF